MRNALNGIASRGLPILILILYCCLTLIHLGTADLESDEGRFGTAGVNILTDHRQLALVSEEPAGGAGTKPYLYPLCIAASISVLGKTEFAVRFVNVIALGFAA